MTLSSLRSRTPVLLVLASLSFSPLVRAGEPPVPDATYRPPVYGQSEIGLLQALEMTLEHSPAIRLEAEVSRASKGPRPEEVRQFAKKNTPGGGARRAAQKLAASQAQDEELPAFKPTQGTKWQAQADAARTCSQIIAAYRAYQALVAGGYRGDAEGNSQTLATLVSKAKSVLARENQKCLKPDDCAKALAQVLASAGEKSPINECQLELRMESYLKYQTEERGTGEVFVKATIPLTWAYEASGEEGENMAYLKGKGNVAYVDLSVDGYTHGNTVVPFERITAFIHTDRPLIEQDAEPETEVEARIGEIIAGLVEDGSTLQMGIGAIPDAALLRLRDKKDLGIHTEMFLGSRGGAVRGRRDHQPGQERAIRTGSSRVS